MSAVLQSGAPRHTEARAGTDPDRGKIIPLRIEYQGTNDSWVVDVDPALIAKLLEPWESWQRTFLVGLLNGLSKTKAAARAGITVRTTQLWQKKDRAFAEAVANCEAIGIGTVLEPELYRRALAGKSDAGSMRALELVLKSRCPEYR